MAPTKVKIDCKKCKFGIIKIPCSLFGGDKDLLRGCKSFLPLGWEDMIYVNEWYIYLPADEKKTIVHHGD